jgi:hypothetical protein
MFRFLLSSALGLATLATFQGDALAGRGGGHRGGHHGGHVRHHGHHAVRHTYWSQPSFYSPGYHIVPATGAPVATAWRSEETPLELQTRRYLSVKNDTEERITLYVQYYTRTTRGTWEWFPADPASSDKAVSYDVEPGQEASLTHKGWDINASRVRIWAVSQGESGNEWMDNKDEDLWLVTETTDGEEAYRAAKMDTYTFTLAP